MKNITNKIQLICLATVLFFGITGCNDWLTLAPPSDLIKEKFWTKSEDVTAALATTYDSYRDNAVNSLIWGEVRADIVDFDSEVTTVADYLSIASSDISASNGKINWSGYYKTINLANTLMHYSNDVFEKDESFSLEMKNRIDGEALFLRALSYFYLVRIWKEVPLVIEPSISDTGNLFVPKSPEHVIIDQIITDLNEAKNKIGNELYLNRPEYFKGRANKYSVMALLADVYLWDEQYQKCIDLCDSIINSGLYSLEPSTSWFNLYNPGNSMAESIFEIQYDDKFDSQENPIYNEQGGIMPISGSSSVLIDEQTLAKYFVPEDIRQCDVNTPTWKYYGVTLSGTLKREKNERDANFIYYRYADILLMKAEALNELDRTMEANDYLYPTFDRAKVAYVEITDKYEMRNAILNERAREFVLEGKRWFDLLRNSKRNGFSNKQLIINMILSGADIKQQAILKTKVYDTMSYYLPIPEREILYNPNLTQNPFYER